MSSRKDGETRRATTVLGTGTNEVEFLEISVGSERFGVNVAKISQLLVWEESKLTRLPSSDQLFLGSYPFRDAHCPVYDLGTILGFESVRESNPLLLVMEFNRKVSGFLVDKVFNIERVSWDQFLPTAEITIDITSQSITGTVLIDKRVIMIPDFEALMAGPDPDLKTGGFGEWLADEIPPTSRYNRADVQILFCEDSGMIRRRTTTILKKAGFSNIEQFSTGASLLNHLQEHPPTVTTLILSDIEMPQLDGLALCKKVKADPKLQHIPFVLFSSLVTEQMEAKCKVVQADAAICKPEIGKIVTCIDDLLAPGFGE